LQRVLEPIYAPIRKILPPMGGLDFTPLIVLVGITILKNFIPGPGLF
jgi:YggT family protein